MNDGIPGAPAEAAGGGVSHAGANLQMITCPRLWLCFGGRAFVTQTCHTWLSLGMSERCLRNRLGPPNFHNNPGDAERVAEHAAIPVRTVSCVAAHFLKILEGDLPPG